MSHATVLMIGFCTVAAAGALAFLATPQTSAQTVESPVVPTPEQAPVVLAQDSRGTTMVQQGPDGVARITVVPDEGPVWRLVLTDTSDYAAFSPFGMARDACIRARDTYQYHATCLHETTGEVLR